PEVLRWALFEAAKSSARRTAPDHAYYAQVKDRLSANRATLSTARNLASPRAWRGRCPRLPEGTGVRAVPTAQQMGRGRLPQGSCRHALAWTTQKDRAAAHPGDHPSIILSPRHGASTQIRLGAPARTTALPSLPGGGP